MTNPQHDNLIVVHVEDHSIIAHAETIGPKFSAGQFGCKLIRMFSVAFQAVTDALQCFLVQFVQVSRGPAGLDQLIGHSFLKASSWVTTRP